MSKPETLIGAAVDHARAAVSGLSDSGPNAAGAQRTGEAHRRSETDAAISYHVAMLEGLNEASPDGILVVDSGGRIISQNRRFLRMWNIPQEVVALRSSEAVLGFIAAQVAESDTVVQRVRHLYEHPQETDRDEIRLKDGRVLDRYSAPVCSQDGFLYGRVWFFRDISAQVRAEESLREAAQQWKSTFDAMVDCVALVDPAGRILKCNAAMAKLVGKPPAELVGCDCCELVHGNDTPPGGCPLPRTLRSGRRESMEMPWRDRWLNVATDPVIDSELRLKGVVHIMTDITERRKGEAERLALERRLMNAQLMESLGIMAGGIAHDFNNLLMVVLGNLDLARSELPPDPAVQQNLDEAIRASRRAIDLTRQMLAYAGKARFVLQPVNLTQVVEEALLSLRSPLTAAIRVEFHRQAPVADIEADPHQLQQVVSSFVTNAMEATIEGERQVEVTVGEKYYSAEELERSRQEDKPPAGRFVYFEVTDRGCGMDPETLSHVFDPFFTTKFQGRGLGMSAALGIVRGHKGAIFIDSELGKGTTVRALFPTVMRPEAEETLWTLEQRLAGKP